MMDGPKEIRLPYADDEPHHGTLMVWPTRPGSWPFQGKFAKRAFTQIIKTIAEGGKSLSFWWAKTIYLKPNFILETKVVYLYLFHQ